jgi:hypothetical protein
MYVLPGAHLIYHLVLPIIWPVWQINIHVPLTTWRCLNKQIFQNHVYKLHKCMCLLWSHTCIGPPVAQCGSNTYSATTPVLHTFYDARQHLHQVARGTAQMCANPAKRDCLSNVVSPANMPCPPPILCPHTPANAAPPPPPPQHDIYIAFHM